MKGNADAVTIEHQTGGIGKDYDYHVSGEPNDVCAWYMKLCRQYPPQGYGTRGKLSTPDADGRITLHAWHAHSCD